MLDCACLAAIVALRHFRRPEVEVVGDEVIVVGVPSPRIHDFSNPPAAPADRTGTDASLDAPHTVLPHIRLLPGQNDPRDPGSQSTGTAAECRGDVDCGQRSAGTVCVAEGRGCSARSGRDTEDSGGVDGQVEGAGQVCEGAAGGRLEDEDGGGRLGQVPPSRYSTANFTCRPGTINRTDRRLSLSLSWTHSGAASPVSPTTPLAKMAPFSKPETILKQAEGLVSVGQTHAALQSLTEMFLSKRFRSTPLASLEPIMLRFVELCVEMRKGRVAKEGLMQYKNIAQNSSVASIEVVVNRFIQLSDAKVQEAQEKADKAVALTDVDDLEAMETPESILLGAVSGDQNKDRTDRALVTPWLKFLWESYRTALETLKNNARLEVIYQACYRSFVLPPSPLTLISLSKLPNKPSSFA